MNKNVLAIFSGSDIEGVSALIRQMEKSPFDYLKLESGGVKITIGKNGAADCDAASAPYAPAPVPAPPVMTAAPASAAEAVSTTAAAPATAAAALTAEIVAEKPGVCIIKAPSYGMFYAQPNPASPPYVVVGSVVKEGDTVGLLEIMKTYISITSDVNGEIIGIHIKNEEIVEPGQALISVRVC
jgi:acetyl-CoA carboxylase biotin carboxyl carrier protein